LRNSQYCLGHRNYSDESDQPSIRSTLK